LLPIVDPLEARGSQGSEAEDPHGAELVPRAVRYIQEDEGQEQGQARSERGPMGPGSLAEPLDEASSPEGDEEPQGEQDDRDVEQVGEEPARILREPNALTRIPAARQGAQVGGNGEVAEEQ